MLKSIHLFSLGKNPLIALLKYADFLFKNRFIKKHDKGEKVQLSAILRSDPDCHFLAKSGERYYRPLLCSL